MSAKLKMMMTMAVFSLGGLACGCDATGGVDQSPNDAHCTQTAQAALKACGLGAEENTWIAIGNCDNVADPTERQACTQVANAALQGAMDECDEQFDAREEICVALGEDPYDPVIDPQDFVEGITNPFLPLAPGTTFVYQGGDEDITVVVTQETKVILGVTCVVVRDTVRRDGQVIEDTEDWYAQDKDGNVWYFGEGSQEFEDGKLVSLEGSWEAGVDNAKAGIIMKAAPQVGDVYRQEFLLGEAEDMAEVLSLEESTSVPAAFCVNTCLVTKDFLPLDPGHIENKYYALGIGLILEINPDTGEQVELVSIETE